LSKAGSATSYLGALGQSLAIAFLGTAAAAVIAVPLGFLAARNVVSGRVVHFMTRRGLHCVR
jgi:phosphonate transport system permease protein